MIHSTINIKNLSIGYRQAGKTKTVHTSINLNAGNGEIIALIGSNGIGKSTLLKTLVRFIHPLQGDIFINERNLYDYSRKELSKVISFVSTENIHVSNVNAFELVSLGRHPFTNWLGMNSEKDNAVVRRALKAVGAEHLSEKFIDEISDGERQRLIIARALAQDTPVIILDEPTAFLDLPNKFEIFHLLVRLTREENKTIILSSHDINIALTEVDKMWLMYSDRIEEGAPEDLILNHNLDKFLENTNVTFDSTEGAFKIRRKFTHKIEVQGDGILYTWTVKSLERLGYQINQDAAWKVMCNSENGFLWTLYNKESKESFDFDTIYSLNLRLKTKT